MCPRKVELTAFICPSCGLHKVYTRSEPQNAYRCYACNVSFIVTNPSYLRLTKLQTTDKCFYRCVAQIEEDTASGFRSIQIPLFYLDPDCQGILDEARAEKIVCDIVNPTGNLRIRVHATTVRVSLETSNR